MTATLRAFLDKLIDYAGLFPPAELSMRGAVTTYARHRRSDHAFMVGRFVCPVNRLEEFHVEGEDVLAELAPVHVAGLASAISSGADIASAAESDAAQILSFEEWGWGVVDSIEAKLPDDVVDGSVERIREVTIAYQSILRHAMFSLDRVYYEISRDGNWPERVDRCVQALAGRPDCGFKIRCGGVTADAYPSPHDVAVAVAACARRGVPFKATAGLHHPVRHDGSDSGITQHGFVNVFGAGILASEMAAAALEELIDERDLSQFVFDDESFSWRNETVPIEVLESARSALAISYGSCDIDEPIEDLRAAGLL